jgi:CRP-like cAMP-binding protein
LQGLFVVVDHKNSTINHISIVNSSLFHLIRSIIPVSTALEERLKGILRRDTFPKRHFLLKEGQVSNYIYFIEKGFIRSYYLKDGKEITSWFMKEGDVIISVNSFYKRLPSYEYIQAIEESTVSFIDYNELHQLYNEFTEFNIVGRRLTEKYYGLSEERLYSMRKQSAEERFKFLLDKYPEIFKRAPLGCIASYLGVSLETVSRIRGKK